MNVLFAPLGGHGPWRHRRRGVEARPLAHKLTVTLSPPAAAPVRR